MKVKPYQVIIGILLLIFILAVSGIIHPSH
jgi:hypothetical protein